VEVRLVAGQDHDAAGGVRAQLALIELLSQPDVEDPRQYCIDPIFRMDMRHHFDSPWHPYSDRVGTRLGRIPHEDRQANSRRVGRERAPLNVLGSDGVKSVLVSLVGSGQNISMVGL
jgi:hypothetical protein